MQIIFIISSVNHYLNKPKGSIRIYRKTKRINVIRFPGNAVCPYVWKYWNTNKPNKRSSENPNIEVSDNLPLLANYHPIHLIKEMMPSMTTTVIEIQKIGGQLSDSAGLTGFTQPFL